MMKQLKTLQKNSLISNRSFFLEHVFCYNGIMRVLFFAFLSLVTCIASPILAESYMDYHELWVDDGEFVIRNDNLGLGITNPQYRLHIFSGDIGVSGDMTVDSSGLITFYDTSVVTPSTLHRIGIGRHSSGHSLVFDPQLSSSATAANAVFITPTGNIGAGLTNPFSKFKYTSAWVEGHAENNNTDSTPVLKARWHEPVYKDYAQIRYDVSSGENTQLSIELGNLFSDAAGTTTASINDAIVFMQGANYESTPTANPIVMKITNAQVMANNTSNSISDLRKKTQIQTIQDATKKLNQLQGVYFKFDYKGEIVHYNKDLQMGFIAQDVAPIVPELIYLTDKYFAVAYPAVAPLLIQGINERAETLSDLDRRLSRMEAMK